MKQNGSARDEYKRTTRESGTRRAEPKRRSQPKRRNSGLTALIITLVIVAVVFGGTAAFGVYISRTDTIYPNTSVDGVDLSGMTVYEAAEALQNAGWDSKEAVVTFTLPAEHSITVAAADVNAVYSAFDAANLAYAAGHDGNVISCIVAYFRTLFGGTEVTIEINPDSAAILSEAQTVVAEVTEDMLGSELEINEDSISVVKGASAVNLDANDLTEAIVEALKARDYGEREYTVTVDGDTELDVDSLYDSVCCEAADAYYDAETDEIVESVVGRDFDKSEATALWESADYGDTVVIPLTLTEPEVTTEDMEEMLFRDELATVTTSLRGSSQNRIDNVKLAAEAVNGTVLAPGEQFSYNDALGERTEERGYKSAAAYSNGQVVQELGGGICQVSSMVYSCALTSNLQIDARTCHYFPVSYISPGIDATVSWGGPEFKFTNSRDWPIRIEASVDVDAKTVTVSFIGTDIDGSYVEMTYSTWYVYNNAEYPDTATGYKAATYRNCYSADGELISRELEAYSEYHYHEEDIVYPTPTPTATPTPEATPTPAVTETPTETAAPVETATPTPDPGYYFED